MSLIGLVTPNLLEAQIKVHPDSIRILKGVDGNIGYIFPKKIAIEYLNIKKNVLTRAQSIIDSLSLRALKQDTTNQVIFLENRKLREIIRNDSTAIQLQQTTLKETEAGLNKMKRRLFLWKVSAGMLSVAGFVVGMALGK